MVWDSLRGANSPVLRPSKGGWPHITVVYSGDRISRDRLLLIGAAVMRRPAFPAKVTLSASRILRLPEGEKKYAVFALVRDAGFIEDVRKYIQAVASSTDLVMHEPHVTYGYYGSEAEAKNASAELDALLPYDVSVVGVSI